MGHQRWRKRGYAALAVGVVPTGPHLAQAVLQNPLPAKPKRPAFYPNDNLADTTRSHQGGSRRGCRVAPGEQMCFAAHPRCRISPPQNTFGRARHPQDTFSNAICGSTMTRTPFGRARRSFGAKPTTTGCGGGSSLGGWAARPPTGSRELTSATCFAANPRARGAAKSKNAIF